MSHPNDRLGPLVQWVVRFSLYGVALPLALFCWWAFLQGDSALERLQRITEVEVWHEPLGNLVLDQAEQANQAATAPDWSNNEWQTTSLPYFVEAGAAIDLPPDAAKERVWLRLRLPEALPEQGRLGLLGFRVMAGGPWALWVEQRLQQANVADWRIQMNVPLRATIPLDAREVYIAFPYALPQGFAVGSFFVGPMDVVDLAWQERNFWYRDIPRFMSGLGLLLVLSSFSLAWARPQDPAFKILGFNALAWSACCFQYFFDPTGHDVLSAWMWSAVDSATTWTVVLGAAFAMDVLNLHFARYRATLLAYGALSTILTLPIWDWQMNAMLGLHYINVGIFLASLGLMGWQILHRPTREGFFIWFAMACQLGMGVHTLQNLSTQTNPDTVFLFPIGTLMLYLAFTYVMSRRTIAALESAERHDLTQRQQLKAQERRLQSQHEQLQKLEVQRHLTLQRESIQQDLHDRLGSNLTSALLQARKGGLSQEETVLLLQDLADELRHIGTSTEQKARSLNALLAELRQRVQNRLNHGGIYLIWEVDPKLDVELDAATAQHVLAMLSESIANVVKHAEATQIKLEARRDTQTVHISVTDNGRGFDPDMVESGRGLTGLRFRCKAIGAEGRYVRAHPTGSRWVLALPTSAH